MLLARFKKLKYYFSVEANVKIIRKNITEKLYFLYKVLIHTYINGTGILSFGVYSLYY